MPCREDLHVNCSRVRACLRTAQSIEARQDEQQKPQALSKIVLNSIAVLAALNVFLEPALADLQARNVLVLVFFELTTETVQRLAF